MSREREDHGLSTADFAAAGQAHHDEPLHHRPDADLAHRDPADDRPLADPMLQAAADERHGGQPMMGAPANGGQPAMAAATDPQQLAPLFLADVAQDFRTRWDAVQIGFVDDPRQAVRQADELVAHVMKSLAETFARQRAEIEADVDQTDQASTENLRVALRRYRSFFQRLLSL